MKKITFLFLALAATLTGFAQVTQTYTFDADLESWAAGGGAAVAHNAANYFTAAGSMELTGAINKVAKNTTVAVAGIGDYTITYKVRGTAGDEIRTQYKIGTNVTQLGDTVLAGTLTGADANADWMEISYPFSLTTAETEIQFQLKMRTDATAYYLDDIVIEKLAVTGTVLTVNMAGSGVITKSPDLAGYAVTDNVTLTAIPQTHWLFDAWSGDLTSTTNPDTILMDVDKTVTGTFIIDPAFDYDFTYDVDGESEGWIKTVSTDVLAVVGGIMTLTTSVDKGSKVRLSNFTVPSGSYQYVDITLQNESALNDELRLTVGAEVLSEIIPVSQTSMNTYQFDLSALTTWTGDVSDVTFRFIDADNAAADKSGDAANVLIERIVFNNTVLGVNEYTNNVNFSLYPNPASNNLTIKSATALTEVKIFDIIGKQVLNVTNFNETINTSSLTNGVYMVSVKDVNNNLSVKKLLIAK